jgi:hypothetical protein
VLHQRVVACPPLLCHERQEVTDDEIVRLDIILVSEVP